MTPAQERANSSSDSEEEEQGAEAKKDESNGNKEKVASADVSGSKKADSPDASDKQDKPEEEPAEKETPETGEEAEEGEEETVENETDHEGQEVTEDQEMLDEGEAEPDHDQEEAMYEEGSPFKKPPVTDSECESMASASHRERHVSITSMDDSMSALSENSSERRASEAAANEELAAQYAHQLAFYRKPIVGKSLLVENHPWQS